MPEKNLKVNIEVSVQKAQQSLSGFSEAVEKATKSLEDLGKKGGKGLGDLDDKAKAAGKTSGGFFNQMTKDVFKGIAAYDLFRKGASMAFGFLKSSMQESMEAARVMAQVKTNVENAGLSFEEIGPKLTAYSKSMIQMGFDDEATADSVSRLTLVTGSYSSALKLNQLAMDLARSKNVDLATATTLVTQVTQGNGRVLKQYGISLSDTASAADNLATLQDKLKGSAAAFSETAAGKLEVVTQQWANMKQEIGDELAPEMKEFLDMLQRNLPVIEKILKNSIGALVRYVDNVLQAVQAVNTQVQILTGTLEQNANAAMELPAGIDAIIQKYNELHPKAQITTEDFKQMDTTLQLRLVRSYKDAVKQTEEASTGFEGVSTSSKDAEKSLDDQAQAMEELDTAYKTVISKQKEFSFKSLGDFQRFGDLLQDTAMNQKDWTRAVTQGFDAFGDRVKDASDDIDALNNKLQDAKDSFQDFLSTTAKDSGGSFAQIVRDAETAIPELEQQMRRLQDRISRASSQGQDTSGDREQLDDLQKELSEKQRIIESSRKKQYNDESEMAKSFQEELKFLRDQEGQTELDVAYNTMVRKIELKRQETDAEIKNIQDQIVIKEQERAFYTAAQNAMTLIFEQAVTARKKSAKIEMDTIGQLTSAVYGAASAYTAMANAAARAGAAQGAALQSRVPQRAAGGPVFAGQSYLVGEQGPEMFTPTVSGKIESNDRTVSAPNGTTIIINNPTVRSDSDIREIIRGVEEAMSRRDELAQMGALK